MRRFKNGGAVCCVSCQRMYVSCRTHQGRTSKTHGGVKAQPFHNPVHQLEPGLRFFDDTIHTYLHPMGRRALHERPWEYHQIGRNNWTSGRHHAALILGSPLASGPRATPKLRSEWVSRWPDLLNQTQSFMDGLSMQRVNKHNCWQHNLTSTKHIMKLPFPREALHTDLTGWGHDEASIPFKDSAHRLERHCTQRDMLNVAITQHSMSRCTIGKRCTQKYMLWLPYLQKALHT